jgi:WhiB family transcriptional regulator, redox-sensing transcriptional regulator
VGPAEYWHWREWAACRGMDSELFFAPDGERGIAKRTRERAAKAVCAACPVREPCLAHALASEERHGVWGGLSEKGRAALLVGAGTPGPGESRRLALHRLAG